MVAMKTQIEETNEKAMIDDEMAYFFGLFRGSYGEVLGELSRTKVNSYRTSSIPLAEFWQPENLGAIRRVLGEAVVLLVGGEGTARETRRRLEAADLLENGSGALILENSLGTQEIIRRSRRMLGLE